MVIVRLLIDNKGTVSEQENVALVPGEQLSDLNLRLFSTPYVRWIFQGRTLQDNIPSNLVSESTLHVIIQSEPIQSSEPEPVEPLPTHIEKALNFAILITISMGWYKLVTVPEFFDYISIFILISFSVLYVLAIVYK